ncbi:hypothetical protein BD324DRAFT_637379 [Kockovaella imperatae]|uniref:FAD/NAD(P)-binding domain-containing protein n=1 Tax=Kockovaella imperatae TaxID=4999 RepID=A0A1Y1U9R2_9TREE|nr:hypothetical protein BD324DRAFT_637379 [Kockovaella imperatae]ORX34284.1 hypothetical protein BD324DRAFT_637379 [Kockovaella imperatae]
MSSSAATHVDLLIIGGGPAGLATASTFARLKRSTSIYDSHVYRNANSAAAHTLMGFEGQDPVVHRRKAREEIERDYDWVNFRDDTIVSLERNDKSGSGFEGLDLTTFKAVDKTGREVLARKVVLATGLKDKMPDIPGITEIWGRRAVHCIFCHGTETSTSPIAVLLNTDAPHFNAMLLDSFTKLWATLKHPKVYILTHGIDPWTPEGEEKSGMKKFQDIIKARRYDIITSPLTSVDSSNDDHLTIHFQDSSSIQVGNINMFPSALLAHSDAESFLRPSLFDGQSLTPMSTVPIIKPDQLSEGDLRFPPFFGDDPRTIVRGLFWAGNCGNAMGNINLSVLQGQIAGFGAGEELGREDMEAEV